MRFIRNSGGTLGVMDRVEEADAQVVDLMAANRVSEAYELAYYHWSDIWGVATVTPVDMEMFLHFLHFTGFLDDMN